MNYYIAHLKLEKHIEGGYFCLHYKAKETVLLSKQTSNTNVQRSASSSIYFLIDKNDFSAWHRLKADEVWHYYDGSSPIDIHIIDTNGRLQTLTVGNPAMCREAQLQILIPAGSWFAAEVRDKSAFGLVGCTVFPGFEYEDFELANRKDLILQFPTHSEIIENFTRTTADTVYEKSNEPSYFISCNKLSAKDYQSILGLKVNPVGGFFCIPFTSTIRTNVFSGSRVDKSAGSAMYYLLESCDYSAWHKMKHDEIWHYYDGGSPIDIYVIDQNGELKIITLGNPSITENAAFQIVIEAGCLRAAEVRDKSSFGLLGRTHAPGYDDIDLELANKDDLIKAYPEYSALIAKFFPG